MSLEDVRRWIETDFKTIAKVTRPLCLICGLPSATTRHHLVPRSTGKSNGAKVRVCQKCHTEIHIRFPADFLAEHGDTPEKLVAIMRNSDPIMKIDSKPSKKRIESRRRKAVGRSARAQKGSEKNIREQAIADALSWVLGRMENGELP